MKFQKYRIFPALFLFLSLLLFGCSQGEEKKNQKPEAYSPGQINVLSPKADGKNTLGGDPVLLDLSNISQGYIMGILSEEGKKINIQIIGPDGVTYKYFLTEAGDYTAFPLTAGDGNYLILAFENVAGDQYASLFSESVDVTLDNEYLPFLYPNQYVDFHEDNRCVQLPQSFLKMPNQILRLWKIFMTILLRILHMTARRLPWWRPATSPI